VPAAARRGEPNLPPTPRRLREARRRGEVAFSRDLTSAAAVAAAVGVLWLGGGAPAARAVAYFREALQAAVTSSDPVRALDAALVVGARALAPPLLAAAAAALLLGALQTRGLVAPAAVAVEPGRLSPAAGWRRLAGGRAAGEAGSGVLKLGLALAVAWVALRPALGALSMLAGAPAPRVLAAFGALGRSLAARLALAGLGIGAADYLLARRRHRRALLMTREEVERDLRETEGDPAHRAQRRRLHRALSAQQMLEDVRASDMVLVAPGEVAMAVALRYTPAVAAAPIVVARGERMVARRIADVAYEAGVPVRDDRRAASVVRSLAERAVSVGEEIPPGLYEAVAEILRVLRAGEP
jgi:flagellar biosynthesis protein FlhB